MVQKSEATERAAFNENNLAQTMIEEYNELKKYEAAPGTVADYLVLKAMMYSYIVASNSHNGQLKDSLVLVRKAEEALETTLHTIITLTIFHCALWFSKYPNYVEDVTALTSTR